MTETVDLAISLAISEKDAREYLNRSTCQCGRRKGYLNSLCYHCYRMLQRLLVADLHLSMRDGYREALENALVYLELPLPPAPDLAMRVADARNKIPFSGRGACGRCQAEVVISPSSQIMLDRGAKIVCLACAAVGEDFATNFRFQPLNSEQLREIRKYVADRN
jgi:hypothetical protein